VEPSVSREPKRNYVRRNSDDEPFCTLSIPYVRTVSEKVVRIIEHYNIKTDFQLYIPLEFI
jgi:hypothetical protein